MSILNATYQIQKTTQLNPKNVIRRISWVLNDRDYHIINKSDKVVIFDDHSGKLKWRGSPVQLKNGLYEIKELESETTVKLTYTMSYTVQIIMLSIILIIAMLDDYHILFLAAALILFSIIHFFSLKGEAKELLLNVVDGDVIQPGQN